MAAGALVLAACGGDDGDGSEQRIAAVDETELTQPTGTDEIDVVDEADVVDEDAGPDVTEPAGDDDDQGSLGAVVVDGVSYRIDEVRRCEPFDDGTIERELEMQGFGENGGDRVQIDVYVQTLAGQPFNDVSWSGPEGVFGNADNPAIDQSEGRAAGVATLNDALSGTETVELEFDLAIPDDAVSCR